MLAVRCRRGLSCPWCERIHRTWHAVAKCRWKRGLAWVAGDPPAGGPCWACVSYCWHPYAGQAIAVTRWADRAEAEQAKAMIDKTGCGGSCSRSHTVYALHLES